MRTRCWRCIRLPSRTVTVSSLAPGRVASRALAVEVLLADPEQLENDALEGDLYLLRTS
jgi:hypothetical protein